MYCYLNNKIIPQERAKINLDDIGLLRGYGVFDFLCTYNGKPFLLQEHLSRLENSTKLLGLKVPLSQKEIKEIIERLLAKNKLKESNIRIVLTGGRTIDGMGCDNKKPTFFILIEKCHSLPASVYRQGSKLITYEYQRDVPRAKILNYLVAVSLQERKKQAGAIEILYTKDSRVLECSTSNFFIFKKDALITAKENILLGTTRNLVLKLARDKFKVEERDILFKELLQAAEAFITSTNREIAPIVKIDKIIIGSGKVGENTKCLMDLFRKHTHGFN